MLERDARQIDGFRRDFEPVHGGCMCDDHLDHANADPEDHLTLALLGARLAGVDQLLPVEVADPLLAKIAFERREFGGLAAPGWFPISHMSSIAGL